MTSRIRLSSNRAVISALLSIVPGVGQIYLHQIFKGLVLMLCFVVAIGIIWLATSNKEFKLITLNEKTLNEKKIMFNPAMKDISFGKQRIRVADIMKVTGTFQLVFAWVYSIVDAWKEGKK